MGERNSDLVPVGKLMLKFKENVLVVQRCSPMPPSSGHSPPSTLLSSNLDSSSPCTVLAGLLSQEGRIMKTTGCRCVHELDLATDCAEIVETAAKLVLCRHFRRREAERHAVDYLHSLIAEVERKNSWQLAEQAGYAHPRCIQRVRDRYAWAADAVRNDLLQYVLAELGDERGVLVMDETGFVKTRQPLSGRGPAILWDRRQIARSGSSSATPALMAT